MKFLCCLFPFVTSETGSNPVTDFQIADHLFHQEEIPTSNHNKNDNSDGNDGNDKEEKANSEENDLSDR